VNGALQELTGFRFCPRCGRASLQVDSVKSWRCGACGFRYFHNVAVAVALLLRVGDDLLFARRAHAPAAGLLDFPGGFVDPGETLEQALVRELEEELGMEIEAAALRYAFSGCNRYPFADVTYLTSDVFFLLELAERPPLECADDVAEAQWHPLDNIPWDQLAFPTLAHAVRRLLEGEQ